MKKYLLAGLLGICTLASVSYAQTGSIPAAAKASFAKLHPQASAVKWDKEDGGYEVNFKENGKTMSVVMNSQGKLKETETDIAVSQLPAVIRDYVAKQMPGKKISEAAMIVDGAGVTKYEAEVGGKDLLFRADGQPIH